MSRRHHQDTTRDSARAPQGTQNGPATEAQSLGPAPLLSRGAAPERSAVEKPGVPSVFQLRGSGGCATLLGRRSKFLVSLVGPSYFTYEPEVGFVCQLNSYGPL